MDKGFWAWVTRVHQRLGRDGIPGGAVMTHVAHKRLGRDGIPSGAVTRVVHKRLAVMAIPGPPTAPPRECTFTLPPPVRPSPKWLCSRVRLLKGGDLKAANDPRLEYICTYTMEPLS